MAKVLKKMEFNDETGKVDIEYDDNTNRSFNLADTVTASTNSSGGVGFVAGDQVLDLGAGASPIPVALRNTFRGNSYLLKHRATTSAEAGSWQVFVPVGAGDYNVFALGTFSNPGGVITHLGRMCLGRIGTNIPANDASVATVGAWTQSAVDTAPGGNYWYSTAAGDSKTFTVNGHTVVLRSMLSTNFGYAVISIDGDWTAANRLPAFTQADADAGLCRAADVGRRYFNGYSNSVGADFHLVLAEGLADSAHAVRFEACGTKPVASSAVRAAVGAVVGCSASDAAGVPGAASRVIARVENAQHFYGGGSSAMLSVLEIERALAAGTFDFLSEMHGGATLVSASITVDGVDKSGIATDTYTAGQVVRISIVGTIACTDATGTPVATKTVDHIFSAYQNSPGIAIPSWTFGVAKNVKNGFTGMLPLGSLKPGGTAITLERWDSFAFGGYQSVPSDIQNNNGQRGNVPALFAVASISGTSRKAYVAILDGGEGNDYFTRSAPDHVYLHDRPDYKKMYFCRSSGAVRESFAVGQTIRSVVGFGMIP